MEGERGDLCPLGIWQSLCGFRQMHTGRPASGELTYHVRAGLAWVLVVRAREKDTAD